jgi:ribosome biogenesis GTPase
MRGLVIKNTGNTYWVRTENGEEIVCQAKGSFRLKGIRSTSPIVVGDYVTIDKNPDGTAFITEIEDRKNYIVRRASNLSKQAHILAANIDEALLCVTVRFPETTTIFIDRFLATAEAYRIPVCFVFNKIDLYDEDDKEYLDGLINLYETIGYPHLETSAETGEGIEDLRERIKKQNNVACRSFGCWKIEFDQCTAKRQLTQSRKNFGLSPQRNAHNHIF